MGHAFHSWNPSRPAWLLALSLCMLVVGCKLTKKGSQTPTDQGIDPTHLVDLEARAQKKSGLEFSDLFAEAEVLRKSKVAMATGPKRSILVLSGGGSYGAFQAGVLRGWGDTGTRPEFAVITGVSTGALLAATTFPGPDRDNVFEAVFTSVSNKDIFRKKNVFAGIATGSMANTAPLRELVDATVNPEYLDRVAGEHARGRRLYIGTTNLETKRQVIWDMGAIASRHRTDPGSQELFRRLLMASTAIPGFFPAVEIPITVDGKQLIEKHVDGGVTAGLFLRPPNLGGSNPKADLAGNDLYCLLAGKLFADPGPPGNDLVSLGSSTLAALLTGQVRDELSEIYAICVFQGLNFHLGVIPKEYPVTMKSAEFNKEQMRDIFNMGRRIGQTGQVWRDTPPGSNPGERPEVRGSNHLHQMPPQSTAPSGLR